MGKKLILVAGNIGAGKTSLIERISKNLGWSIGYESVSDNPYLPDFYSNRKAWSFHLQIYFLGQRASQHLEVTQHEESAILDCGVYGDAGVYAKALYQLGDISLRDYNSYLQLYQIIEKNLPKPDLLLYLGAPINILMERIKQRNLGFDVSIDMDYLTFINTLYEDWIENFQLCPIMKIDTSQYNYIDRPVDLDKIITQMLNYVGD